MKDSIRTYCQHRLDEVGRLKDARRETLDKIVAYLKFKEDQPSHFLFIDLDNSRTSHYLKIWTMVAGHYFNKRQVDAFCVGETKDAVHPNVVKSLLDIGFDVLVVGSEANPTYALRFDDELPPCLCVSKKFEDIVHWPPYMACIRLENEDWHGQIESELDLFLPYNNPSFSEGSSLQDETYYQLCAQVAREVFYVFQQVNQA